MIIDYISSHQAEFWLVFGFALLALEVITGFVAGVFMFAGLGAIITGGLMSFNVLPETWLAGISSTGISTGVVTAALWNTLKKLQNDKPVEKDNSSDLVGHTFIVDSEITPTKPGKTNYSGLSWSVELDHAGGMDKIEAGQRVVVTSVEVGKFKVKQA